MQGSAVDYHIQKLPMTEPKINTSTQITVSYHSIPVIYITILSFLERCKTVVWIFCHISPPFSSTGGKYTTNHRGNSLMKNIPIGQILVENGFLKEDQLEEALEKQRSEPGKKLGDVLLELGYVSETQRRRHCLSVLKCRSSTSQPQRSI